MPSPKIYSYKLCYQWCRLWGTDGCPQKEVHPFARVCPEYRSWGGIVRVELIKPQPPSGRVMR
jgi:hypothetical protein